VRCSSLLVQAAQRGSPICLWRICWPGTHDTKKIWLTNSFNSSEKRLARVLLLLSHFRKGVVPETNPQDQSGDPRGDDRHDLLAGELFHEQV
jgi:hypothetical protein